MLSALFGCVRGRPKQIFYRNTESRNSLFSKAEPKPKPNIRPKHIIRPKQISSAKIDCFGQEFLFSHAILDYHKWPKQLLLAKTCSFGQIICFGRITKTEDCQNTEYRINFGRIYSAETKPKQYSVDHQAACSLSRRRLASDQMSSHSSIQLYLTSLKKSVDNAPSGRR